MATRTLRSSVSSAICSRWSMRHGFRWPNRRRFLRNSNFARYSKRCWVSITCSRKTRRLGRTRVCRAAPKVLPSEASRATRYCGEVASHGRLLGRASVVCSFDLNAQIGRERVSVPRRRREGKGAGGLSWCESGGTADAPDLGSGAARRGGSSPPSRISLSAHARPEAPAHDRAGADRPSRPPPSGLGRALSTRANPALLCSSRPV